MKVERLKRCAVAHFPDFFSSHCKYSNNVRMCGQASCSALQLALENLADKIRVRLALAELHDLAFEEIQSGDFAGAEVFGAFLIRGDDFVAELFDRAGITDLGQAFLLHDGIWHLTAVEHVGEDLL